MIVGNAGGIHTLADIAAGPHNQGRGMIKSFVMDDGSLVALPGTHRCNAPRLG